MRNDTAAVAEALVSPTAPLRLPKLGTDGTTRGDRTAVRRLTHLDGAPAVLSATLAPGGAFALRAKAATPELADRALARLRFWTGVDDEVAPFLDGFADDKLIGRSVQEAPWARPFRRPMPFELLAAAICEQLIDDERSQQIKRALIHRHGPRLGDLVDAPDAATVAALSSAELEACGLAAKRATTLRKAAREVAAGRVDLLADGEAREAGWRRLRAMPGIGPWTLSILALHGQGVFDALPAGDHAYQMAVGAIQAGRPQKATELEVVAFMEPYRPWRGLAGWHLLRTARARPASRR